MSSHRAFWAALVFARPLHSTSQVGKASEHVCVGATQQIFFFQAVTLQWLFLFEAVPECAKVFFCGRHSHASKASHMSLGVD